MDYDLPETISHGKYIVVIIIIFLVSAAMGYMAYRQFMKWHEEELQAAVAYQQQLNAEKSAELEYQILQLQNKLTMLEPPPVPDDRLQEVFGTPPADAPGEQSLPCDALKNKISAFFNYLKENAYVEKDPSGKNPSETFAQLIRALSANPPLITDETRDMVSLKHNMAHFYRVMKKDRFEMVKSILSAENDVLEHAMADFYTYYACGDCCKNADEACVSLNTLYEYAGFFVHTFAGRSYLFRRNSAIRCLTDYYSVLILDRANDEGINRYGIDIRPYIDLAEENIASQNNLIFQDHYLETLTGLQEKYGS